MPPQERLGVLPRGVLAAELRERVDAQHLGLELQAAAGEAAVVGVELVERAPRVAARQRQARAIERAELLAERRGSAPRPALAGMSGARPGARRRSDRCWAGAVAGATGWCSA